MFAANSSKKMKMTWKKNDVNKSKGRKRPLTVNPNLPFLQDDDDDDDTTKQDQVLLVAVNNNTSAKKPSISIEGNYNLAQQFEDQGNKLAEEGKYREALGKWETAITLMPERAVLHEQKAQLLLELEEAWGALKAATRATELEPNWADAWVTLGRAQLNYGEPDCAIDSFDKALALKPDSVEAKDDRHSAVNLVKKRKQLHSTGLSSTENRFLVGDQASA